MTPARLKKLSDPALEIVGDVVACEIEIRKLAPRLRASLRKALPELKELALFDLLWEFQQEEEKRDQTRNAVASAHVLEHAEAKVMDLRPMTPRELFRASAARLLRMAMEDSDPLLLETEMQTLGKRLAMMRGEREKGG